MKCAKCEDLIAVEAESVMCSVCSSKYHYGCSVREAKWRNMSGEQKKVWACANCKVGGGSSSSSTQNDVDNTGEEELSTRTLLLRINSRLDTLDEVKKTVDGLSTSMEFLGSKYDELLEEVKGYREQNKQLAQRVDQLQAESTQKDKDLKHLTNRFNALEQYGRGVNMEIHGLKMTGYETSESILQNTAKVLGLTYNPAVIQAAHRIPSRNTDRPPMFLVQFTNKAIKQQWLQFGRKKKIYSQDIVGEGDSRVYLNENLTPFYSGLFRETKALAKKNDYKFVWLLNGTIRVRKNEQSRKVIIVHSYEDLKQIV